MRVCAALVSVAQSNPQGRRCDVPRGRRTQGRRLPLSTTSWHPQLSFEACNSLPCAPKRSLAGNCSAAAPCWASSCPRGCAHAGGCAGGVIADLASLVALGPGSQEEPGRSSAVPASPAAPCAVQHRTTRRPCLVSCCQRPLHPTVPICRPQVRLPIAQLPQHVSARSSCPAYRLCRYGGLWRTRVLGVTFTGRPKPFGPSGDAGGLLGGSTMRLARVLIGDPGGAQAELVLAYDARCACCACCGCYGVMKQAQPGGWRVNTLPARQHGQNCSPGPCHRPDSYSLPPPPGRAGTS